MPGESTPPRGADGRRRPRGRLRAPRPRGAATAASPRSTTSTSTSRRSEITAFIGPSGCGKSTVLRCLNRMNDLIAGRQGRRARSATTARTSTARRSTRSRCAAASAWCSRSRTRSRSRSTTTSRSARASTAAQAASSTTSSSRRSRRAALWDEVKDKLKKSGVRALGRPAAAPVHRARARGASPTSILMDEPCSALDPIATVAHRGPDGRAQARLHDRDRHAQHAAGRARLRHDRVLHRRGRRRTVTGVGRLVEYDATEKIFTNPSDPRTEGYITGRFG